MQVPFVLYGLNSAFHTYGIFMQDIGLQLPVCRDPEPHSPDQISAPLLAQVSNHSASWYLPETLPILKNN